MKYIELGQSKKMSKIGLGTGRFGTRVEKSLSFEMMDCFEGNGGTLIDTARNYYEWVENGRGMSEKCIGEWMELRNNRDKMCVSTKGGMWNEGKLFFYNLSKDYLSEEIKESLEALRTDYIDVYLLHRDEPERPVEEIVETMQVIREMGDIGQIGVANWKIERIKAANAYAEKNGLHPFTIVQTWWSLAQYTESMWNDPTTTHMDMETYAYLKEKNYIGMAYTSQCKGFFQKAISQGIDAIDPFLYKRIVTSANLKKLDYISDFCKQNDVSPTAFVNGYITSNALEGTALVSVSDIGQLEEILKCSDYILAEEVISEIDGIF